MLMLGSGEIGIMHSPHTLRKKNCEQCEENACHLMPQRSSGMRQPLPEGLAKALSPNSHRASLRDVLWSLLLRRLGCQTRCFGCLTRSHLRLSANTVHDDTRSAS